MCSLVDFERFTTNFLKDYELFHIENDNTSSPGNLMGKKYVASIADLTQLKNQ